MRGAKRMVSKARARSRIRFPPNVIDFFFFVDAIVWDAIRNDRDFNYGQNWQSGSRSANFQPTELYVGVTKTPSLIIFLVSSCEI